MKNRRRDSAPKSDHRHPFIVAWRAPILDRVELHPTEDRSRDPRERPAADESDNGEYQRDQTFLACGGSTAELLRSAHCADRRRAIKAKRGLGRVELVTFRARFRHIRWFEQTRAVIPSYG